MEGYKITVNEEKRKFPFRTRGAKTNVYQSFDRTKIQIKQAGVEFNLYDKIQENTEGTDIYQTLKKFGSLDSMQKSTSQIYADVTELQALRSQKDLQAVITKGKEIWQSLPIEEKAKFGHDVFKFIEQGEKHYKEAINNKKTNLENQPEKGVEKK